MKTISPRKLHESPIQKEKEMTKSSTRKLNEEVKQRSPRGQVNRISPRGKGLSKTTSSKFVDTEPVPGTMLTELNASNFDDPEPIKPKVLPLLD